MLQVAIEAEVAEYIEKHSSERGEDGRQLVVRNGRARSRTVDTGVGRLEVQQPRVNDKRRAPDGSRFRFTSKILPPYLRRTKGVEKLAPFSEEQWFLPA